MYSLWNFSYKYHAKKLLFLGKLQPSHVNYICLALTKSHYKVHRNWAAITDYMLASKIENAPKEVGIFI